MLINENENTRLWLNLTWIENKNNYFLLVYWYISILFLPEMCRLFGRATFILMQWVLVIASWRCANLQPERWSRWVRPALVRPWYSSRNNNTWRYEVRMLHCHAWIRGNRMTQRPCSFINKMNVTRINGAFPYWRNDCWDSAPLHPYSHLHVLSAIKIFRNLVSYLNPIVLNTHSFVLTMHLVLDLCIQ